MDAEYELEWNMGDGLDNSDPMKKWMLIPLLVFVAACGKGELDPGTLTNNPFDPDYSGTPVFSTDTTYLETVSVTTPQGTFNITYQVISFDVDESLFLAPADYTVSVVDQESGASIILGPSPAGSSHFVYHKADLVIGSAVCLQLQLFNDQSAARAEVICATLQ